MSDYEPPQPIIFPPIFNSLNWPPFEDQVGGGGGVGPQGPQGTGGIGNQGFQGRQGPQGNQGNQGNQGDIGTNGNQGNQGFQGLQGNQGNQGVQGLQGNQGNQGNAGTNGNQGFQGVQGVQGSQGFQGAESLNYLGENTTPSLFATSKTLGGITGLQGASLESNNVIFGSLAFGMFNELAGSFFRGNKFGLDFYTGIVVSRIGQHRLMTTGAVGGYQGSSNFGKTWSPPTGIPAKQNQGVAMSSDGKYWAIGQSSGICVSDNYGVSFTERQVISGSQQVVMSGDGKYMYLQVDSGGGIYRSTNYGATGSFVKVLNYAHGTFQGFACSASGQYILSIGIFSGTRPQYLSKDYGNTWITISNTGGRGASISGSGQYMFYGNPLVRSSDYGQTFTSWTTPITFESIAVSSTGQYIVGGITSQAEIYLSTDFGNTFTKIYQDASQTLADGTVSISGNGQYILASGRDTTSGSYTNNISYAMNIDNSISRQYQNNIVLNATDTIFNTGGTGSTGFFVKPIRNGDTGSQILSYNNTSGEIQYTPRSYFAQYYDTTDQAHAGGTGQSITFNTTDFQSGISLVSGSQITVSQTGKYALSYSLQFINTDSQEQYVDVFFWKNGSVLADSNSEFAITRTQSGINGKLIAATTLFFDLVATDYLELYWYALSTDVDLEYIAAGTYVPATPSAFVNIQLISS